MTRKDPMTIRFTEQEEPIVTRAAEPAVRAKRVLLAEDDPDMRGMLAAALRLDHHEVVEARDGRELLERFSASRVAGLPVDVIITDLRMPKLTGLQVLRELHDAKHRIPVILITAFGDHGTHIDAWLLGAAAVLDKPFEVEDLRRLVRNLGKRPAEPEL